MLKDIQDIYELRYLIMLVVSILSSSMLLV